MAVVVAAGIPSAAHAEFTLKHCEGGPVQGEGSSFQNAAQGELKLVFNSSFGCEGSLSRSPVTYVSDGSGCGIASIGGGPSTGKCSDFESAAATKGYRDANTRFGGSDAPLTPEQQATADAEGGPHPGLIHILPIAVGATAVIVHFPEGCQLENPGPGPASANEDTTTGGPNDPGADDSSGDLYSEGTLRLHIPAGTLEEIWSGKPMTWGEVTKDRMTGKPTNALETEEGFTSSCDEVPVRRVVRFDGSGTTYNFKAYLSLLPVGVGGSTNNPVWEKSPVVGTNTTWPLTTSSTGVPKAVPTKAGAKEVVNECNLTVSGPDRICTGSANGNPFVAAAVAATDGSIGYSDLATARQNGFTITPNKEAVAKPGNDDLTYWIPLQTVNPEKPVSERVGANYAEPSVSPISNIGNGTEVRGSNCTNADYRGIPAVTASDPDPTLGDWANAIGTGSKDTSTYPNCAITYDFVWDDDAPVYGDTPEEQSKARTVKDYFETVESEGGQLSLQGEDYGALSPGIIKIARIGVEAIGWDKAAGSSKPEEGKKAATTTTTTTTPTIITPPVIPSNAFSIAGAKVKGKGIVLSLVLPDAGTVQVKATGGGVTVGGASASVSGGKGTVTLAISKAALSKLAKAKGHKLSVKITVTFTPTGGTAASQTKTLTVTQAAVTPKKKASKKGKKK
ncbi:MAG TPA: hypothetical protein VIJ39_02385 [Solirubrobacteraceae bacterium]